MKKRFATVFVIVLMFFVFSFCLFACNENPIKFKRPFSASSSDGGASDDIAVSISMATDEQASNVNDYIHVVDKENLNTDWKIVITVTAEINDFKFLELDESEILRVVKSHYETKSLKIGDAFVIHTYINDATLNRGISYKDENGKTRYFGIRCNMNGDSIYLEEINFLKV